MLEQMPHSYTVGNVVLVILSYFTVSTKRKYTLVSKQSAQEPGGLEVK